MLDASHVHEILPLKKYYASPFRKRPSKNYSTVMRPSKPKTGVVVELVGRHFELLHRPTGHL